MRRLVQIDAAQSVLIDALKGETFLISFSTSIEYLRIKNASPGQLYVFILKQNAAGKHRIAWGGQVLNATAIDPQPNSVTVQKCVGQPGGILQATIPGT